MIVVAQLSSGWQHNYSTKTRQAGRPMYSLVFIGLSLKNILLVGLTS
jgi:hypothetical protein